jgi:hypothetical protein
MEIFICVAKKSGMSNAHYQEYTTEEVTRASSKQTKTRDERRPRNVRKRSERGIRERTSEQE